MSKDEKQAWDKLDEESSLNYSYFLKYLDLGYKRSLKMTHKKNPKNTPKIDRLKKLSAKFSWVSRAEAYDEYNININRLRRAKQVEDFMSEEMDIALKRQKIIQNNLEGLRDDEEIGKNKTSISHAIKSNSNAFKENMEVILRLAGLPSNITQNINDTKLQAKVDNNVKISEDELLDEISELEATLNKSDNDGD